MILDSDLFIFACFYLFEAADPLFAKQRPRRKWKSDTRAKKEHTLFSTRHFILYSIPKIKEAART